MLKQLSLAVGLSALALSGCTTSNQRYYEAMEKAAASNASAHVEKMRALSQLAQSADPAAQGAAVMAMALSQTPVITPQYVETGALAWARVLATPMAALGGLYLQTDLAKHQSNNTAQVQLGQITSNEAIQLSNNQTQSATILGLTNSLSQGAVAGSQAVAGVATVGFNALEGLSASFTQSNENTVGNFLNFAEQTNTTNAQTITTLNGRTLDSLDLTTNTLNDIVGTALNSGNENVLNILTNPNTLTNTSICTVDPTTGAVSCS